MASPKYLVEQLFHGLEEHASNQAFSTSLRQSDLLSESTPQTGKF
ncbi:MAG: hypothetical protein VYA34_01565 [Myxococcota bacterium]|nr:hypothetical protein [Myxococcota bacterium]